MARESVTTRCSSAESLPDIFVCFVHGSQRPRRYMRSGENSWDLCLWIGYWQFSDNISDAFAVADFEDAGQKYQVILPEERGE